MGDSLPEPAGGTRTFLPALQGLRAAAALAVVVTHVAVQTGEFHGLHGRLLIRLDLAVAVFFALSGFLLWRGHAAAAHGLRPAPATGPYLRSRLVRIMPAYLVAVVLILALLPDVHFADLSVWLANLTLTQVYVPQTLVAGLTQMWSLSVEVTFYLALPLLALAAAKLPVRMRVPAIVAVAVASLGWGYLPIPAPYEANPLNWAPAYASWFAVGMLLAELTCRPEGRVHRLARRPVPMAGLALVAYVLSASPLAIPAVGVHASVEQFVFRTAMGAIIAWALLAPLVLDRPSASHRVLASPVMVTLGEWSYGLFIWHLAALSLVFPMLDRHPSDGGFVGVLVLTLFFGLAMAAVSYALIEEPCRMALHRWEVRRKAAVLPLAGSAGAQDGTRTRAA
ncbi:acyltransferase [Mycolicibacterium fluoranthenivorans]|uniref:Acyltransferase n=1 Tax=Mycolicibacterium fluoranthenivorans TaxID=258505 RepID=A0A7G8P8H8_9MYCO|nr:acyltransferase [Mycolicibacterium fluoranthenivorans]QNJ90644.1 acyltransferase [Mycolicibacterium fluoranthenivorans]